MTAISWSVRGLEDPQTGARELARDALDILSTYCHCDAMTTTKDDRLQIRVDPIEKRLLGRAAAASHISVSAFVLQSAATRAATVLADRPLIALSPDAAEAFSDAMNRPAAVNERLTAALERPRKFRWID